MTFWNRYCIYLELLFFSAMLRVRLETRHLGWIQTPVTNVTFPCNLDKDPSVRRQIVLYMYEFSIKIRAKTRRCRF